MRLIISFTLLYSLLWVGWLSPLAPVLTISCAFAFVLYFKD